MTAKAKSAKAKTVRKKVPAPAPRPGQNWNLKDLADQGVLFQTLVGTFEAEPSYEFVRGGKVVRRKVGTPELGNLSLHFWRITDYEDNQHAHKQDEAYYVVDGTGTIEVGGYLGGESVGRKIPLKTADIVFVPRCTWHRFTVPKGKSLTLLVVFSPDYTGESSWEADI